MFRNFSEKLFHFVKDYQTIFIGAAVGFIGLGLKRLLKETPKNSLKGKKELKIIITGGSHGLGLSMIREFLSMGHHVVTCSRTPVKDEKVSQHKNFNWIKTDLSEEKECDKFVDSAVEKLGGQVDIFISNACSSGSVGINFTEIPKEEIKKWTDIDIFAPILLTHKISNIMSKQVNGGHIFITQGFGEDGRIQKGMTMLGTVKRSLDYFYHSLLNENPYENVGIHEIQPGMIVNQQPFEKLLDFAWISNIIADTPGNIARYVTPRVCQVSGTAQRIQFISNLSIGLRFVISPFYRKNLVNEKTGKILVDIN